MKHICTYNLKYGNSVNLCADKQQQPAISVLICDSRAATRSDCRLLPVLLQILSCAEYAKLSPSVFKMCGKPAWSQCVMLMITFQVPACAHNQCFCFCFFLFFLNNPEQTRMHFEHNCHSNHIVSNEKCLKKRIESSILCFFYILQLFSL